MSKKSAAIKAAFLLAAGLAVRSCMIGTYEMKQEQIEQGNFIELSRRDREIRAFEQLGANKPGCSEALVKFRPLYLESKGSWSFLFKKYEIPSTFKIYGETYKDVVDVCGYPPREESPASSPTYVPNPLFPKMGPAVLPVLP